MDRNLLLPVAGTLVVVLLVYLVVASSVSIAPTPPDEGAPASSAVRSPAPTLLEQHSDQPAEVQAIAALADAGLGSLVVCSLTSPLEGVLDTAPWPTHVTNTSAAFLVPEHATNVKVLGSDGEGLADLEWTAGTPSRCTTVERWLYTVEVTVLEEDGTPVNDASVLLSGRPIAGADPDGVYRQRRSARERPDPDGAATVLSAKAARGEERGSASANVVDDRVQLTVVLGKDAGPAARFAQMSMQSQAVRAMTNRRALNAAISKAMSRDGLPDEVLEVLTGWGGRRTELPEPAKVLGARPMPIAPTKVPIAPKDRETQKRVPPVP